MAGTTAPTVMPFYGNSATSVGVPGQQQQQQQQQQPATGMIEAAFAPPLRERYTNSVWHPAAAGDPNGVAAWTPQGQFIQQLPPQLDDLRYHHHTQYTAYHQPTVSYQPQPQQSQATVFDQQPPAAAVFQPQPQQQGPQQQPQQAAQQQYGSRPPSSPAQAQAPRGSYSQPHTPQPSPQQANHSGATGLPANGPVNGHGGPVSGASNASVHRNGTVNGGNQYIDASPGSQFSEQREYVNGNYNPSQDVTMAPPPSTTPTSRSSSVHMDPSGTDSLVNSGANKANAYNSQAQNATGHPNALPGYLLHPQMQHQHQQQSSQNSSSSRYPGQENIMGDLWEGSRQQQGWQSQEGNEPEPGGEPPFRERSNLNSRLKTMILNKQQQQQQQVNQQQYTQQPQTQLNGAFSTDRPHENSDGNFLVRGHHPQNNPSTVTSEGGGFPWDWVGGNGPEVDAGALSAMENFIKYATGGDEREQRKSGSSLSPANWHSPSAQATAEKMEQHRSESFEDSSSKGQSASVFKSVQGETVPIKRTANAEVSFDRQQNNPISAFKCQQNNEAAFQLQQHTNNTVFKMQQTNNSTFECQQRNNETSFMCQQGNETTLQHQHQQQNTQAAFEDQQKEREMSFKCQQQERDTGFKTQQNIEAGFQVQPNIDVGYKCQKQNSRSPFKSQQQSGDSAFKCQQKTESVFTLPQQNNEPTFQCQQQDVNLAFKQQANNDAVFNCSQTTETSFKTQSNLDPQLKTLQSSDSNSNSHHPQDENFVCHQNNQSLFKYQQNHDTTKNQQKNDPSFKCQQKTESTFQGQQLGESTFNFPFNTDPSFKPENGTEFKKQQPIETPFKCPQQNEKACNYQQDSCTTFKTQQQSNSNNTNFKCVPGIDVAFNCQQSVESAYKCQTESKTTFDEQQKTIETAFKPLQPTDGSYDQCQQVPTGFKCQPANVHTYHHQQQGGERDQSGQTVPFRQQSNEGIFPCQQDTGMSLHSQKTVTGIGEGPPSDRQFQPGNRYEGGEFMDNKSFHQQMGIGVFQQKPEQQDNNTYGQSVKMEARPQTPPLSPSHTKGNYPFKGDGGPTPLEKMSGSWCCRRGGTDTPAPEHLRDGCCQGLQTADELDTGQNWGDGPPTPTSGAARELQEHVERLKNNARTEVPDCSCFTADKSPPEPGSYYTHLGAGPNLPELRKDVESRTGLQGKAIRFEKVVYTGKEGKTQQGCPLAKWIIRRSSMDEKILCIVKHRQGHKCSTAWIVVVMVAWEGVPAVEADRAYGLLTHKLNRFGLPTTRRCATNEPRTCACQGLDPDTCGASFSFGCSWSMYYNGCKYARSKTVRKFRLSVRSEEQEVEERMHVLATLLSPLYQTLAPAAWRNQTQFEREASECRLGFKPGRPFSGVTACLDFCAHSHRDLHNMNNGCTVVVSLTKHRSLSKADDEQLHVLPLYIMDETDEFGSKEAQEAKVKSGAIEALTKYPCEVRVRSVPLQPCRRHGKKRKEDEPDAVIKPPKETSTSSASTTNSVTAAAATAAAAARAGLGADVMTSMLEGMEAQLQSSQVSSTVLDTPMPVYQGWGYEARTTAADMYHARHRPWGWGTPEFEPDSTSSLAGNPFVGSPQPSTSPFVQQSPQQQWQGSSPYPQRSASATATAATAPRASPSKSPSPGSPWTQQPSWDTSSAATTATTPTSPTQASPFRVPKARPPSRTTASVATTESMPTYSKSFLKPFTPPSEKGTSSEGVSGLTDAWQRQQQAAAAAAAAAAQAPVKQESSAWGDFRYGGAGYGHQPFYGYPPSYPTPDGYGYPYADPLKQEAAAACYHASAAYHHQFRWDLYGHTHPFFPPPVPEPPRAEPIGEVTGYCDNEECFKDSQMGGVAIALGHGSVLFECAKHELHATTALRRPDRLRPTRISLVFYQHRNLNRAKHGWDEWEEKMRLRKLGVTTSASTPSSPSSAQTSTRPSTLPPTDRPTYTAQFLMRTPTYTTTTWTTLFPMHPCMVTGPYQEGGAVG